MSEVLLQGAILSRSFHLDSLSVCVCVCVCVCDDEVDVKVQSGDRLHFILIT